MEQPPLPSDKSDLSRARGQGPIENKGYFVEGIVIRALPGLYSYSVETANKEVLACKNAATATATIVGVKDLATISVGTPVMVWIPVKGSRDGIIMCAIPGHKAGTGQVTPRQFTSDPESGFALYSEEYYKALVKDKSNNQKIFAQAGRPLDVNPGDWGKINEHGVFLGILGLTAVMRASQGCAIEVHTLDDLLRLRSGQYQHFTSFGEHHIYNDGGQISVEICGSSRQHEVCGKDAIGSEIFEETSSADNNNKDLHIKPMEVEATLKRRFQMFFGHLGLLQMFVANPEEGDEKYSRAANHQGLFHMSVGDNGRFDVTSAAGVAITRDEIIPIPKKLKEPWDPSGDKPEESNKAEAKEGFELPDGFTGGTHLAVRDMTAWAKRHSYQRFDELEKDWHVPEATDLESPKNGYDKISGSGVESTEPFDKYKDKRCGIYTNPDGSVTIMDAAGSQIVLDGKGGIQIGGAGNVTIMPGTNVVLMGGDDVIIKAKNSVDISATAKDVRIKAEKNLHAYSGGGVLVESAGEKGGHGFTDGTVGEDNATSGVTIKAKKRVFIWGEDVFISGIKSMAIEVAKGASSGIKFIADTVKVVANNIRLAANGKAQLELSEGGNAYLVASTSAAIAGQSSVTVAQGAEHWVPLTKIDAVDPGAIILPSGQSDKATQYDGDRSWMGEYNESGRDPIKFTFRNETQYATTDFELYQLAWQQLIDKNPVALKDAGISSSDTWEEKEVNGTMPFPGIEKMSSSVYIVLSGGEVNVDENGKMKARTAMTKTVQFTRSSLSEYKTRKR